MNTKCPQCATSYNITEAHIGRKVKCKSCSAALIVTEDGLELQIAPAAPASRAEPPSAFEFGGGADDHGQDEEKPRKPAKAKGSRREAVEDEPYEEDRPSKVRKAKSPSNFGAYLTFRKMIVPVIIQIIFWLIVGIIVISALGYAAIFMMSGNTMMILGALVGLLIGIPFWILIVRIYCELIVVIFRIYDTLTDIKTLLEKQSGGNQETVSEV